MAFVLAFTRAVLTSLAAVAGLVGAQTCHVTQEQRWPMFDKYNPLNPQWSTTPGRPGSSSGNEFVWPLNYASVPGINNPNTSISDPVRAALGICGSLEAPIASALLLVRCRACH